MQQAIDSRILVVEDDPKMCASIQVLLQVHGFDAKTSTTLPDAQNALSSDRYDLVLLDLKLADQCGFALMDQLVEQRTDTRVIVVTGQHSEQYAITALKKGAIDYLKKPFEADELIESVHTVLDRQRHQRILELFKYAVSTSSVAIAVGSSDGKIVYANQTYRKLMHINGGAGGRLANDSTQGDGYGPEDVQIRKVVETGIRWEGKVDLVDAAGNPLVVFKRVDPIPEKIAGAAYGIALICDISTQLERERMVAHSRDRYRKVIDSQHESLFRLDSDFRITFVNQTWASAHAMLPRAMIGMPITDVVQPSNHARLLSTIEAIRSGSPPVEIEFNGIDSEGTPHWQQWRFEGIRHANGKLIEVQAVGRDISVSKRAEKRLQEESEKLKQALAKVKRLSGMLPICASCKKIRDDSGYWSRLEEYIENNSDAEFSHGICPECARNLYPEIYE